MTETLRVLMLPGWRDSDADTERDDMPPQLFSWRPMVRQRLPFAAQVLYSDDDPYCAPARAWALAADWGAVATSGGRRGHVHGDSGLADWPAGLQQLQALRGAAA